MNTSLAAPKQLTPPRTPSTALPQLPPELAPPLVAMFAPLAVWAANWSETPSAEALVAVALCGGGAALVTGLMNLIYRDRPRAALAALLVVVYTFGYGLLFEAIVRLAALHPAFMIRDQVLRIVCNVGLILALAALRRWRPEVSGLMRGAGLFALLLTAAALVSLGRGAVGERGADEAILPPEIAALPEQTAEPPRDIYYLVFDRYADAETLREHFAWDNGPFLAALRERGFAVAEEARANYPKTEISIASSLNMRYHGNQLGSAGHYRRQMAEHEVGRLLKGHGYRYFHLGCPLEGLRSNPQADVNYRFSPMPGEFSEILFRLTPAYSWWPPTEAMRQEEEKFELLGRLPAAPGPKFVFAHFLLPHPPWKFNADGSRRLPSVALAASETENYVEQVQYANAQILKLIDTIARDSARPPIILLAADEGPELRYEGDGELSAEARIRKRSGILLAARLPDRPAAELLPPRSTPVNLFRTVLREYFAAPLPPLDDRAYFWEPANALGKPEWSAAELHDVSEFVWPAETADE